MTTQSCILRAIIYLTIDLKDDELLFLQEELNETIKLKKIERPDTSPLARMAGLQE